MAKKKVSKKKAAKKVETPKEKETRSFLEAQREYKRKQQEDFTKRFPR